MRHKIQYLIPAIRNRIDFEKPKLFKYIPIDKYSMWGIDAINGKEDILVRLVRMLGSDIFPVVRNDEETQAIVKAANKTCAHIFNVLGSGDVQMHDILWNQDLKTKHQWKQHEFYLNQRVQTPKGSDIKMPWEMSRCHHLLWLGEAYLITGDDAYAKEVVDEMLHWIEQNPLMYTVNWTCSMEVAIRSVNWLYALLFIAESPYFDDNFAITVYKSLYQHAFFIQNNLEKSIPYSNNHYVSDIVGLLYLGTFFHTTSRGEKIFRFAKSEFIKETKIQVLSSGLDYEWSVSYHRLMTELLVYSRCMLERIGETLPNEMESSLSRMLEYVGHYSSGTNSPLIADNDNGRFLPFVPRAFKSHTYLIDESSIENKIINRGIRPLFIDNDFVGSKFYPDANICILKKGGKYLFASCCSRFRFDQSTDKYTGTHLHNDLLSFVYMDGGKELIVDPGAYCYTSDIDMRNEFRATRKHNTAIVDDEEQNLLAKNQAFAMKYNSNAKPMSIKEDNKLVCSGEYQTIKGKMTHQRDWQLSENGLKVMDNIFKNGLNHHLSLCFHFAKDVHPSLAGNEVALSVDKKKYRISFVCENPLQLELVQDTISPSYGVIEPSISLIVNVNFGNNILIQTLIMDDDDKTIR